MKSKIRTAYIIQYTFLILLVCGLVGLMIYDLGDKMHLWLKIAMWTVLVGFPVFTIYSYASITKITIDQDVLTYKSILKTKKIPFTEIKTITLEVYQKRLYSLGNYYIIKSTKNGEIEIPENIYTNENELIARIRNRLKA